MRGGKLRDGLSQSTQSCTWPTVRDVMMWGGKTGKLGNCPLSNKEVVLCMPFYDTLTASKVGGRRLRKSINNDVMLKMLVSHKWLVTLAVPGHPSQAVHTCLDMRIFLTRITSCR